MIARISQDPLLYRFVRLSGLPVSGFAPSGYCAFLFYIKLMPQCLLNSRHSSNSFLKGFRTQILIYGDEQAFKEPMIN